MYDSSNVAFFRLCGFCNHGHVRHGIYRTVPDKPQPHPCDYCEWHCTGYALPPLRDWPSDYEIAHAQ